MVLPAEGGPYRMQHSVATLEGLYSTRRPAGTPWNTLGHPGTLSPSTHTTRGLHVPLQSPHTTRGPRGPEKGAPCTHPCNPTHGRQARVPLWNGRGNPLRTAQSAHARPSAHTAHSARHTGPPRTPRKPQNTLGHHAHQGTLEPPRTPRTPRNTKNPRSPKTPWNTLETPDPTGHQEPHRATRTPAGTHQHALPTHRTGTTTNTRPTRPHSNTPLRTPLTPVTGHSLHPLPGRRS